MASACTEAVKRFPVLHLSVVVFYWVLWKFWILLLFCKVATCNFHDIGWTTQLNWVSALQLFWGSLLSMDLCLLTSCLGCNSSWLRWPVCSCLICLYYLNIPTKNVLLLYHIIIIIIPQTTKLWRVNNVFDWSVCQKFHLASLFTWQILTKLDVNLLYGNILKPIYFQGQRSRSKLNYFWL